MKFHNLFFILKETQEYTRNVVRYCLEALQDWFDAINFVDEVCLCIVCIKKCLKFCCVGDSIQDSVHARQVLYY